MSDLSTEMISIGDLQLDQWMGEALSGVDESDEVADTKVAFENSELRKLSSESVVWDENLQAKLKGIKAAAIVLCLGVTQASANGSTSTWPVHQPAATQYAMPEAIKQSSPEQHAEPTEHSWDMDDYLSRQAAEWMSENGNADY